MSAWMFIPYVNKKVEERIWTQELAQQFIYEIVKIDLEQDRFDKEMIEHWKKLKESKN